MTRRLVLVVLLLASPCIALVALATPGLPVGGFSSPNVEWLGNIAIGHSGAGWATGST